MDITALSPAMSQQQVLSQVGTAVLAKTMDTAEQIGDSMTKMMEQSVAPGIGQSVDITL